MSGEAAKKKFDADKYIEQMRELAGEKKKQTELFEEG
jgi:hypothetical protein